MKNSHQAATGEYALVSCHNAAFDVITEDPRKPRGHKQVVRDIKDIHRGRLNRPGFSSSIVRAESVDCVHNIPKRGIYTIKDKLRDDDFGPEND